MTLQENKRKIREYIVGMLLNGDDRDLKDDTDLQESGLLDSLSTLHDRLPEKTFGIQIDPADSTPTLSAIWIRWRLWCNKRKGDPMDNQEKTLRDIIAKIAEVAADFPIDADFRDGLGLDSYRGLELVFELERVFKIKIPETRIPNSRHFGRPWHWSRH